MLRQRLGNASHMTPFRLLARDPTRRYWRLKELREWEATLSRERSPAVSAAANKARREAIAGARLRPLISFAGEQERRSEVARR